jgi:hypothetical protein
VFLFVDMRGSIYGLRAGGAQQLPELEFGEAKRSVSVPGGSGGYFKGSQDEEDANDKKIFKANIPEPQSDSNASNTSHKANNDEEANKKGAGGDDEYGDDDFDEEEEDVPEEEDIPRFVGFYSVVSSIFWLLGA